MIDSCGTVHCKANYHNLCLPLATAHFKWNLPHFKTKFGRREKPSLSLYAERLARKRLVPFLYLLVWRGQGSNPWPPVYGANHWATAAVKRSYDRCPNGILINTITRTKETYKKEMRLRFPTYFCIALI